MKKFFAGLILTIAAISALLLIPSQQLAAPMPWQITVMPDGQISVFNIHLASTNYRQAQQSFRSYGQTSIFSQAGEPSTVEAFFNSVNIGGLSAKVVLNLVVNDNEIKEMKSRATEAKLQPSGAHRYQLSNQDKLTLIDATVSAITYIPSVRLDREIILYRFGNTDNVMKDPKNSNTEVWQYPTLGLTIYLNDSKKTIMQYQIIDAQ